MKLKIFLFLFFILFLISLASSGSGCCSGHGGVDCSAGPQLNGKVICTDKWENSSCYYGSVEICDNYNLLKNNIEKKTEEIKIPAGKIENEIEIKSENKLEEKLKDIKLKENKQIRFEVKDISKKENVIILNNAENIKKERNNFNAELPKKILSDALKKFVIFWKNKKNTP